MGEKDDPMAFQDELLAVGAAESDLGFHLHELAPEIGHVEMEGSVELAPVIELPRPDLDASVFAAYAEDFKDVA